jgi:hypothetical protein
MLGLLIYWVWCGWPKPTQWVGRRHLPNGPDQPAPLACSSGFSFGSGRYPSQASVKCRNLLRSWQALSFMIIVGIFDWATHRRLSGTARFGPWNSVTGILACWCLNRVLLFQLTGVLSDRIGRRRSSSHCLFTLITSIWINCRLVVWVLYGIMACMG